MSKHSGITINISTEAVVRVIVISVFSFFVIKFVGQIGFQLQLILASAFLALALNPAVAWISHRLHIKSRIAATGIAYLLVLGVLISFLAVVAPPLVKQTANFVREAPRTVQDAKNQDSTLGRFVHRYNLDSQVDVLSNKVSSQFGDVPSTLWDVITRVGGTLISVLTVIVLTFMMLVDGPVWTERFWKVSNQEKRKHRKKIATKMYQVITGYVNGQVLIAAIAASFAFVALMIGSRVVDVSVNAVALAGIVFLFGLIPLIGNTLAAIVVVLVCLFSSWPLAIIMAVFFPIYQQIENSTLTPHIQSKGTRLTPLLVFTSALIGAGVGGIFGAFLAIPVAGCLRIWIEDRFGYLAPDTEDIETIDEA